MAWQTPKTNWKPTDTYNIGDYKRWIGNIAYLHELAQEVYKSFELADMGPYQTYKGMPYADEFNALEANLTSLCNNTYPFSIGEARTYYTNQPSINWQEVNRIESACLLIYNNLTGQIAGRQRLSITLGGAKPL